MLENLNIQKHLVRTIANEAMHTKSIPRVESELVDIFSNVASNEIDLIKFLLKTGFKFDPIHWVDIDIMVFNK